MVTKSNSLTEAPYDRRSGNLLHYAYRSIWHEPDSAVEWRPNDPMELRLTVEGVNSGRSAKYVTWFDADGRHYPMFVSDIVEMFREGITVTDGRVEGIFRVRKRGQNYGLTYCGPIPAGSPEVR